MLRGWVGGRFAAFRLALSVLHIWSGWVVELLALGP